MKRPGKARARVVNSMDAKSGLIVAGAPPLTERTLMVPPSSPEYSFPA